MPEERPCNLLLAVTPDSNPSTFKAFGGCVKDVLSVMKRVVFLVKLDTDEASAGAVLDVKSVGSPGPPSTYEKEIIIFAITSSCIN